MGIVHMDPEPSAAESAEGAARKGDACHGTFLSAR